jgi:hypothetical protein
MNPVVELRQWISVRLALRRRQSRFDVAFDLDVAHDIAAEADAHQKKIVADAYAAEQSDIEAAQLLETAKRDGLDASDMPAIERALRHIRNSAKRDHQIAEVAST